MLLAATASAQTTPQAFTLELLSQSGPSPVLNAAKMTVLSSVTTQAAELSVSIIDFTSLGIVGGETGIVANYIVRSSAPVVNTFLNIESSGVTGVWVSASQTGTIYRSPDAAGCWLNNSCLVSGQIPVSLPVNRLISVILYANVCNLNTSPPNANFRCNGIRNFPNSKIKISIKDAPGSTTLQFSAVNSSCYQLQGQAECLVRPSIKPVTPPPSCVLSDIPRTGKFKVTCVDSTTKQPVTGCQIQLKLSTSPYSGFHDHDDSARPVGSIFPVTSAVSAGGVEITYQAPEVSGLVTLTITGTQPNGVALDAMSVKMRAEVEGLGFMPESTDYNLVGSSGVTSLHLENHWGLPTLVASLQSVGTDYAAEYPGQKLAFNDMSLPYGGLFDIGNNWRPSHCGHRLGDSVDVRFVPAANDARFRKLLDLHGLKIKYTHNTHYHVQLK